MRKYLYRLTLFAVFFLLPAMASSEEMDESSYGVIDAVYLHESRLVIDDASILYTDQSRFKNSFGRQLSDVGKVKKRSYVKYSLIEDGESLTLRELQIISKQEYDYEKIKKNLEDH